MTNQLALIIDSHLFFFLNSMLCHHGCGCDVKRKILFMHTCQMSLIECTRNKSINHIARVESKWILVVCDLSWRVPCNDILNPEIAIGIRNKSQCTSLSLKISYCSALFEYGTVQHSIQYSSIVKKWTDQRSDLFSFLKVTRIHNNNLFT